MSAIDEFFQHRRYATVDVDPSVGWGKDAYAKLCRDGREVFVVMAQPSPSAEQAAGKVYRSLEEVPAPLDGVLLNVEADPQRMLREVGTAVGKGVPRIWIENRCEATEAVLYAREHGVQVIDNVCSLMVLAPNHVHWMHRRVLDLLGKTPAPLQPTGS